MIRFVSVALVLFLLHTHSLAHEAPENKAKISVHQHSISLNLSIHASAWTESYAVYDLDDAVSQNTSLTINRNPVSLKLKKIEKKSDHYSIDYLAEHTPGAKLESMGIRLPKQLGNVIVTMVRATSKLASSGKNARFIFE